MPWSNLARVPQLLSLLARALEPQLPSHMLQVLRAAHFEPGSTREATTMRSLSMAMKSGPHLLQLEKSRAKQQRSSSQKELT